MSGCGDTRIERLEVKAFVVPAASPESDGTVAWNKTTLVTVELTAGGHTGLGCTYADLSTATLIHTELARFALGRDAMSPRAVFIAMAQAVRNLGRRGVAAMAMSAVDIAAWDLKARLLGLPVTALIGAVRPSVAVYGSGGFTSYSIPVLQAQLAGWAEEGIAAVKMKVGMQPERDPERVRAAREAVGPEVRLMVDANGAYSRKQALDKAARFAESGVVWFEEPVSSDDVAGLRHLRDYAPPGMEIAAGEYAYDPFLFRELLQEGAVDIIQADATRCGGVTGFLAAAELADAWNAPLSANSAPAIHGHLCCCCPRARDVEYFHDHARIEAALMEGALVPDGGVLRPDPAAAGFGIRLREEDAREFLVVSEASELALL